MPTLEGFLITVVSITFTLWCMVLALRAMRHMLILVRPFRLSRVSQARIESLQVDDFRGVLERMIEDDLLDVLSIAVEQIHARRGDHSRSVGFMAGH